MVSEGREGAPPAWLVTKPQSPRGRRFPALLCRARGIQSFLCECPRDLRRSFAVDGAPDVPAHHGGGMQVYNSFFPLLIRYPKWKTDIGKRLSHIANKS